MKRVAEEVSPDDREVRQRIGDADESYVTIIKCHIRTAAEADFSLRMGPRSSLYEVIQQLFKKSLTTILDGENIHSHLWRIKSDNKRKTKFVAPEVMRDCAMFGLDSDDDSSEDEDEDEDEPDKKWSVRHIGESHPVTLKSLALSIGDEFTFYYDEHSGRPSVVVMEVMALEDYNADRVEHQQLPSRVGEDFETPGKSFLHQLDHEGNENVGLNHVTPEQGLEPPAEKKPYSLTEEEIKASINWRELRLDHPEMEYSRCQKKIISASPPNWDSQTEEKALIFLIYTGYSFTKAWNGFLEHTLLQRSKVSGRINIPSDVVFLCF